MKNISISLLFFVLIISPVYSIQEEEGSPLDAAKTDFDINDYHFIFWGGAGYQTIRSNEYREAYRPGIIFIGGFELPFSNSVAVEGLLYNWHSIRYHFTKKVAPSQYNKEIWCNDYGYSLSLKFYIDVGSRIIRPSINFGLSSFRIKQFIGFDFGLNLEYVYTNDIAFGFTARALIEYPDFGAQSLSYALPTFYAITMRYRI